tara:strand:+ start:84 stop:629 length:546 start_codon:yes stop_codon:yes gene_type:complete
MANLDAAFGMNPVEKIGSGPSGKLGEYKIAASEANAIFQGSVVMPDSGYIQVGAAGSAPFTGVFWGCKYDDPTTNKPTFKNQYATTSAVADAFVYDDPYQVFEIQADGAFAQTAIQQAADITAESGSTTTGVSTQELDSSDIGTGANLMIIGISGNPGRNELGSNNGVFKVLIQEHTYANL